MRTRAHGYMRAGGHARLGATGRVSGRVRVRTYVCKRESARAGGGSRDGTRVPSSGARGGPLSCGANGSRSVRVLAPLAESAGIDSEGRRHLVSRETSALAESAERWSRSGRRSRALLRSVTRRLAIRDLFDASLRSEPPMFHVKHRVTSTESSDSRRDGRACLPRAALTGGAPESWRRVSVLRVRVMRSPRARGRA